MSHSRPTQPDRPLLRKVTAGIIIALAVGLVLVFVVQEFGFRRVQHNCTVSSVDYSQTRRQMGHYRLTSTCGKFDLDADRAGIEIGGTYDFTVTGFRLGIFRPQIKEYRAVTDLPPGPAPVPGVFST